MAITKTYSMPRGDSRTLPISLPLDTYSAGAKLYFALKRTVDNVLDDASAVFKTEITDADIISITDTAVNYVFKIKKEDTNLITPGNYRAELQFVSQDKEIVITYPDPEYIEWYWTITGDVNRRTS